MMSKDTVQVPRKPTVQMMMAFNGTERYDLRTFGDRYAAMLAAAPPVAAEAELADKAAERLAYDAVIDLLFERLPDAKCMGELPGVVDELRQQLAAAREDAEALQWLIANGERVFGTLWREASKGDIETARGKAQPSTDPQSSPPSA